MKTKPNKKIHQTHGSLPEDENSVLNTALKKSPKISSANITIKELESMSLAELQEYAANLGLVPEDNKTALLRRIKKEL